MNSGVTDVIAATRVRDVVDVTSEDSFPASDPPSWTPVVGIGPPCRIGRPAGVDARASRDERPAPSCTRSSTPTPRGARSRSPPESGAHHR
jgi:hypothetical protein